MKFSDRETIYKGEIKLTPKELKILDEYKQNRSNFVRLSSIVNGMIEENTSGFTNTIMQLTSRIKTEDSLYGKLQRKPDRYSSVFDLSDIVGFRIICYFSDQVDSIAEMLKQIFVIDRENSIDKRKVLAPTTFGYLSLHYICRLPDKPQYTAELKKIRFEIQIRSVLQHVWAEIEHDLGYKNEFGIPRDAKREFARVAGLLETADDAFLRIRNRVYQYEEDAKSKIMLDNADDLSLDHHTIGEFMKNNVLIKDFTDSIAAISGARLIPANPESYLAQLAFFKVQTIGDLKEMINREREHAYFLAEKRLKDSEIDELVSTVGLYYLVRAKLVYGKMDELALIDFFRITYKDKISIKKQVERIVEQRRELLK